MNSFVRQFTGNRVGLHAKAIALAVVHLTSRCCQTTSANLAVGTGRFFHLQSIGYGGEALCAFECEDEMGENRKI